MEAGWLDRFAALLPPGGRVLDIGCGMGKPIASWLIGRGFAVTGIDSAPALITMAAREFPAARWPAVRWLVADMRNLTRAETFNGLLAWDSFFHLDESDQRSMFAVFRAHAAPGAALIFTSGRRAGVAMGTFRGEPLFHASLDPSDYQALLAAEGFQVIAHVAEDAACGGHTVWLAQLMPPGSYQRHETLTRAAHPTGAAARFRAVRAASQAAGSRARRSRANQDSIPAAKSFDRW